MTAAVRLIDVPEPELLFGHGQRMAHPKGGLLLYGPSEPIQLKQIPPRRTAFI